MVFNKKQFNRLYIFCIFALLAMIGIGYANVGSLLSINGVTNIRQNTWDVKFENLAYPVTNPVANKASDANVSITDNTTVTFTSDLTTPGDVFRFSVEVYNNGSIDAMLDGFSMIPVSVPKYLRYSVFWDDNGNVPKDYDSLTSKGRLKLDVIVEFRTDIQATDLLATGTEFTMQVEMNFVQADKNAVALSSNNFSTDSWDTIKNILTVKPDTYSVGDEKCVKLNGYSTTNENGCNGDFKVRIANKSTPTECSASGFSQTACGFVVEFEDIIATHYMNPVGDYKGVNYPNGWNKDGYPATVLRTFLNTDIFNALPSDLQNIMGETFAVSGRGSDDKNNFTSTDRLYLLSGHEIYEDGDDKYISSNDAAFDKTRQLDYYKNNGVTTSKNLEFAIKKYSNVDSHWWLRSAYLYNNYHFLGVYSSSGIWYHPYVYSGNVGISPAFRIV